MIIIQILDEKDANLAQVYSIFCPFVLRRRPLRVMPLPGLLWLHEGSPLGAADPGRRFDDLFDFVHEHRQPPHRAPPQRPADMAGRPLRG